MNRPKFIKTGTAIAGLLLLIGCSQKDKLTTPSGSWQVINPTGFVPPSAVMYQPKTTGTAPAPIQVLSTLPVPIAPSDKPVVVTANVPPVPEVAITSNSAPSQKALVYRMGFTDRGNTQSMPNTQPIITPDTVKGVSNATR